MSHVICAWCQKHIGEQAPVTSKDIKYKICDVCNKKMSTGEYDVVDFKHNPNLTKDEELMNFIKKAAKTNKYYAALYNSLDPDKDYSFVELAYMIEVVEAQKIPDNPYSSKSKFCYERLKDPKRYDSKSFRTVKAKKHRLTFGCPKGEYSSRTGRCRVPVELQRILHPAGEKGCKIPGKEIRKKNPMSQEATLVSLFAKYQLNIVDITDEEVYTAIGEPEGREIRVLFSSLKFGGEMPKNISELMNIAQKKIGATSWNFQKDDVVVFTFDNPTKHIKKNPGSKKVVVLKDSSTGEYRVPGPAGTEAQAYYTDDRNDAIGTAKSMWKNSDIVFTFRHIPSFDRFLKENPGAKWHSEKAEEHYRQYEKYGSVSTLSKYNAHKESEYESKKLGLNPKHIKKNPINPTIEAHAVKLSLEGLSFDEVSQHLIAAYNIGSGIADHYVNRAFDILEGKIKHISPQVEILLQKTKMI